MTPHEPIPPASLHGGAASGRRARVAAILVVSISLFALQFALFRSRIPRPAPLSQVGRFDGIVVLTGGPGRIAHGLALLRHGHTARLLVSGVHARVGPEIFARTFRVDPALVTCCITLDHAARDTSGNAREAVKWARALGLARVGVVSAAWHLPRGMLEIERQRRARRIATRFIPLAVPGAADGGMLRRDWAMTRESVKYWLARVRAALDDREADFPTREETKKK